MEKLKFTFKNGEEIICDSEINYAEIRDFIVFKVTQSQFRIRLSEELYFIKEDNESIFEIKKVGEEYVASYTLKERDVTLDIDLASFEYEKNGKKYIIKYSIQGDEVNEKCIILSIS